MNRTLALAVLTAVGLAACHSDDRIPTASNPTPAPTPTPAVAATPRAFSCPLPSLPDLHNECPKLTPELNEFVDKAIDQTVKDHPELFDLNDAIFDGSYRVLDRGKYVKAVVEAIHAQGVCAIENVEEIGVKTSNAFNEQYNIWVTSGYLHKGRGSYVTTCFPAQF